MKLSILTTLTILLSAPFLAAIDTTTSPAHLEVGPLLGGQDLVYDLRTTEPFAFSLAIVGIDGTPTSLGLVKPVLQVNLAGASLLVRVLDGAGRDRLEIPTVPGTYGPTCTGLPLFFQTLVKPTDGDLVLASNREAVEIEPCGAPTSFLTDVSSTHLPADWDTMAAIDVRPLDVERDGDTDLVLGNGFDVFLWTNDGSGTFSDASASLPSSGMAVGTVEVFDVDGDNRDDIVVAGGFDDFVSVPDRLLKNDGAGGFVEDPGFPVGGGQTQSFAFADFDGDGDVDYVAGIGEEEHLATPGGLDAFYRGDGAGTFTRDGAFDDAAWNDPDKRTTTIRAGDIDDDGTIDLFVTRTDNNTNVLLDNNGVGSFTDVTSTRLLPFGFLDNSQDSVLADLDMDGDLDILVANSHASVVASNSGDLYINDGTGTFTEDAASIFELSTPADWIRLSVTAADLDADGDPDVAMGVHDLFLGADQAIYTNDGGVQSGVTGAFTRESWFDPPDAITYGILPFDMDADGDADYVITGNGVVGGTPPGTETRLFENTVF